VAHLRKNTLYKTKIETRHSFCTGSMLVKRVGYKFLVYELDGIRVANPWLWCSYQNLADLNMGKASRYRLEDLQESNAQLREENEHLKEQVQMFNQRMAEMEKNLGTSSKLLPLLKKKFEERWDTLTVVMTDWDTHIAQLVHLGEKVI